MKKNQLTISNCLMKFTIVQVIIKMQYLVCSDVSLVLILGQISEMNTYIVGLEL